MVVLVRLAFLVMSVIPQPPTARLPTQRTALFPANLPSPCSSRGHQLLVASTSNGAAHYAAYPSGASSNGVAAPEPPSDTVKQLLQEAGYDLDSSGLRYLSNAARERVLQSKVNKVEKMKNAKCGSSAWTEVSELGQLIREGKTKWEDLNLDDVDMRLKWSGLFHRRKRAPGTFMMRLKVPNGDLTVKQLRYLGDCIAPFGDKGCGDITTRANAQLRGVTLAEADKICQGLVDHGLSSTMTGLDNVRNITGSPISGIDPHELLDVRPLVHAINAMHTNNGLGNPELANLPRKLNIGLSNSRDDFPHTHINDVGLKAVKHPDTGEVGFNVELGGYFSIKRNTVSIDGNTFVTQEQVVPYCKALLEVFRDNGPRADRQKSRLMWLVEEWGPDKFREAIGERMGVKLQQGAHEEHNDEFKRRDLIGIHAQKQEGLSWACACVPAGRVFADDFHEFAKIAERYGDGTVRLTVEQNVLFPNIPNDRLEALKQEPLFQKYRLEPASLTRGLVSCTGSEFCGVAIIETKNRAMEMARKLEEELDFPEGVAPPRMHWTGCPNSCGQVQVADIGLMGGPAKLNGKATEGVRIFKGGSVGEGAELGAEFEKGVACAEESGPLSNFRLARRTFSDTPGILSTAELSAVQPGKSHSIGQAVRESRLSVRSRRGQTLGRNIPRSAHRRHDQDDLEQRPPYDLLVVMPTTIDRLALVEAGRTWRKGLQAYIVLDRPLEGANVSSSLLAGIDEYQETYGHFGDIHNGRIWSQPGDARAALTPFRANRTVGLDNYTWILYGDDDTIWFPDNVLRLVNGLDHDTPYFLTDHIWFPEWKGRRDRNIHASRRAPRCLPCNYTDPLEATGVGPALNIFKAVKACPCNLEALCKGADNPHIINSWDCRFTKWRPAWWYFAHGGAGAVLSSGLFRRADYSEVENKVWNQRGFSSGDSAFTDIVWDKMRVLPTDPGPGYFRRHVRLFDPGWRGPQAKAGAQDAGTEDWGNDPPGLITRFQDALEGRADAETIEALDWVVTSHIRSRFSSADVSPDKVDEMVAQEPVLAAAPDKLQPPAYMHFKLGQLGQAYAQMKASKKKNKHAGLMSP
ncbi:hypothetical protein WJX73_004054 [Symbiochloris irregularis]|uniref:Ferredoxin--nitrite reductase, chloroplastic n=1 Tax=Symbiochloris irregularis TaxID=706552 RepID=A0AAW1P0A5_9CHLO